MVASNVMKMIDLIKMHETQVAEIIKLSIDSYTEVTIHT